jgi:hypothetical protein
MAFTAATSQTLVQTTIDKLAIAAKSIEIYRDNSNNPGLLAGVVTDLNAVTVAIAAVSA